MARVQMLHHISGGRGDGTDWPQRHGFLECGDAEAAKLVRAELARWPQDEPQPPAAATTDASAADEPPDEENGSESDGKPRVRDPKEAWEQYAVTVHGLNVNTARSMTKSDLIALAG